MSKQGVFIRYWLPVLAWAALIFWGSTDLLSDRQTSRFIGPILRWLMPDLTDVAVEQVQFAVRKVGHLVEYGILAALVCRALRGPEHSRSWSWQRARLTFLLATTYAVTDELHQTTVASRYGSGWDVLVDAAGVALGLGAVWWFGGNRSRRR